MPVVSIPSQFSAQRARSYVFKLPLFTRVVIFAIVATWVAELVVGTQWDVKAWGALVPDDVGISSCKSLVLGGVASGGKKDQRGTSGSQG